MKLSFKLRRKRVKASRFSARFQPVSKRNAYNSKVSVPALSVQRKERHGIFINIEDGTGLSIITADGGSFKITGPVKYSREYDTYYCAGESWPAEIVAAILKGRKGGGHD